MPNLALNIAYAKFDTQNDIALEKIFDARASPMECYFLVVLLKFGIEHKIYALMLYYFVCQI